MRILIMLMLMGFFTGLKSASRDTENKAMTAVGWAVCVFLGIIQMAYVSGGYGQTFWAVVFFVFISQISSVLALTAPRKWLDAITIVSFVTGWMVMGVDLLTLAVGGCIAAFVYPLAHNYTIKGDWLKKSRSNLIKVVVLFGMVLAWVFAHEHFTINIYTVIRWFIH